MDSGLLGAMIGATVFGAVLSWWERGPDGLASARRQESRHLLPWVGLRLLAALVAARGLITVLTWPAGRVLGALCLLFALPYLLPWPFARLCIARGWLGWAEGFGRLAAAHFGGSSVTGGFMARAWTAWLHDDAAELEATTERLEAWGHGPESVVCRAAIAELAGNAKEAREQLESLRDFLPLLPALPTRAWVKRLDEALPAVRDASAPASPAALLPPGVADALDGSSPGVAQWCARWEEHVDVEIILQELRSTLARWATPLALVDPRDSLDWGAELEAFRARAQRGADIPIHLEWATWCALRARAERVTGPQGALHLRELWDPASHFAVRLWSEPGARPLAAAVLRWLEQRARQLDDKARHASASHQLMLAS